MNPISTIHRQIPYPNYRIYDVSFYNYSIRSLVTDNPDVVNLWLADTERIHRKRLHKLIVGLDVEWSPSFNRTIRNRVATLQLCAGQRCLIYQLSHSPFFPQSLYDFLENDDYCFLGVGIENDVEKLLMDYNLGVNRTVDIRVLASNVYDPRECRNAGLKGLARVVLGLEIEKPRSVTMSDWENHPLSVDQVQYACIDAFLSFEIGKALNAS